jgi:hypothetical protein
VLAGTQIALGVGGGSIAIALVIGLMLGSSPAMGRAGSTICCCCSSIRSTLFRR